jgi:hypothetical protein
MTQPRASFPTVALLLVLAACADPLANANTVPGRVVILPGQARLAAVGDTARLRAALYDETGEPVPGAPVTWTSADPDVFTIDQSGLVTGTRALSVGRAIATVGTRADTAYVVVANPDVSPCLGYPAPVSLAVGEAVGVDLFDATCLVAAEADAEYLIVPWQGSRVGSSILPLEVVGNGLAALGPSASLAPSASGTTARSAPSRSFDFERGLRELGRRELLSRAREGRDVLEARSKSAARAAAIPTFLAVGDLVDLNANVAAACTTPSTRTGRVAAISARAIVVHDTANPAGGFTDADYRRFAVTFDTLVAPVADAAFGAPTDVDVNGKVLVFFTRAVNELTPSNASYYFGGFFHPRDLLPKQRYGSAYCPGSNEGEMFYMLVPDPNGVVNNNIRTVGFVDSVTVGILAHEHQHLVNFSRRVYVNGAYYDEEVWLNEGLSHVAEELVFYRASGTTPRQNIGGSSFGTPTFDEAFARYMAPNFGRLHTFLESPQSFSPYSSNDDLGTRGAAWAFLRYAADRRGSSDGDVWQRLVNSTTYGFDNLAAVFGSGVLVMMHDWNLSMYTDDYVPGVGAGESEPSWNFRTTYPAMPVSPRPYPLAAAVRTLSDGVEETVTLRGGSAAFYRFGVTAGREAAIRVTSDGALAPPVVRATVVRTR